MRPTSKNYIIFSIFLIVILIITAFVVWPLFVGVKANSEELISVRDNIVTTNAQILETENFKDNYATYKSNLNKIDQLYIDPNNPVDFIKFLEDKAYESQVVPLISLSSDSKNSKKSINFQVSTKGNFANILEFAKGVEFGPYLVEIESLTIQAEASSEKSNATFNIKVFIKQ